MHRRGGSGAFGGYKRGWRPQNSSVYSNTARRAHAAAVMSTNTTLPRYNLTAFNETNSNSTTEVPLIDNFGERLANALNVYYTPMLILCGTLGNILSVIVFYTSKLRLQSTSQYLSALAISDTIFLFQLLPPWMKAVNASGLFTKQIFCELFVYVSYVSCNHSAWLVVAFTLERFVAVVYPLRRNAMCTVKRARHIILTLAACSLLVNLPVLRFAVPSGNDCNIDHEWMEAAARFNLVDTVVSFTLPLVVIIVLNSWIMVGVYRLGRARSNLMKNNNGETGVVGMNRALNWHRSQQRVTRMLLVVSTVFVLLNLPAYTMRIIAYANNMSEHEYIGKWAAVQQICLLFFNTNFGINFYLYCMSGQNFRRALIQAYRRYFKFWDNDEDSPRRNTSATRPPRPTSMSTSFISNTEGTNCTGTVAAPVPSTSGLGGESRSGVITDPSGTFTGRRRMRHLREQRVVRRWRFDNSRQQYAAGAPPAAAATGMEMTNLRPHPLPQPQNNM